MNNINKELEDISDDLKKTKSAILAIIAKINVKHNKLLFRDLKRNYQAIDATIHDLNFLADFDIIIRK